MVITHPMASYVNLLLNVPSGKQWHAPRSAFRPRAGNSTYEKRTEERKAIAAVKAKEKEMKEEKEAERQVCHYSDSANATCLGLNKNDDGT